LGLKKGASRTLRLLVDWAPFIVVYILFESLRGLVPKVVLRIDAKTPLVFEQSLFGAPLSLIMYHYRSLMVEYFSSIIYAMHPVDAVLLALLLYAHRRRSYYRYISSFMITSIIGLALYFAWPVAPPWMVLPGTRIPNYLARFISLLRGATYGDPNPFAAMPSLHMAIALLVAYYLYVSYRSGWVRGFAVSWPILMLFSIIYTGNHYLLDAIIGLIIGAAGIKLGEAYSVRFEAGLEKVKRRGDLSLKAVDSHVSTLLEALHSYSSLDIGDAEKLFLRFRRMLDNARRRHERI